MRLQRVLLVDGSYFLRDILRRFFEKMAGFSVVGVVEFSANLAKLIQETKADWVIISLPPGGKLPSHFRTWMLTKFPFTRVMGISTDGSEVRVEWVGLHEKKFHGLTFEGLREILITDINRNEKDDHDLRSVQ